MPESPTFLQARPHAQDFVNAGDTGRARAVLEEAVDRGRAGLAHGDPELLATMRQLARLHAEADDPAAARRLLEEALAGGQQRGEADPLMLMLAFDLAVVAEQLGNRHVARTYFGRVAEFGPAALGVDDWAVFKARAYLAGDSNEPVTAPPAPSSAPPVSAPPVSAQPLSTQPAFAQPPPGQQVSGQPLAAQPLSAQPVSAQPFSTQPAFAQPPPGQQVSGVPVGGGGPRKWWPWVLAALGVVVVVAVVAFVVRPGHKTDTAVSASGHPAVAAVRLTDNGTSIVVAWDDPAAGGASIFTVSGGPQGQAPAAMGQAGPTVTSVEIDGLDKSVNYCFSVITTYGTTASATSPQACTARAGAAVPSMAASVSATPKAEASASTTPKASPSITPTTATVATRITSPANGGKAPWAFQARFTVSPTDATAGGNVLAVTICVSGVCYLDGELQISGGKAAPYGIHLGSTKPEGVGIKWTVRLDRLSNKAYTNLVAERDAEIADSTWGSKGTSMSSLNPSPVSSVTVTKS